MSLLLSPGRDAGCHGAKRARRTVPVARNEPEEPSPWHEMRQKNRPGGTEKELK